MSVHRGLIVQPTYRIRNGIPVVRLFGRLETGEAFLVEDDRFRPYFFVPAAHAGLAKAAHNADVTETGLRDLTGRRVVRVTTDVPASVPALRERIERDGGQTLEADIRFPYRYLIDHGVRVAVEIEGDAVIGTSGLVRFENPTLRPTICRPKLRTLSIDLETSLDASRIFSVALVGAGADEVHLVSKKPVEAAIVVDDEPSLLDGVARRIREIDPDIITGWNVVDFDLRVWSERCKAQRVMAPLGRVQGDILFQRDRSFTRQSRATIPGRMVVDGIPLVRDAVRLEDYRLETVARKLLGRGKLIDGESVDAAEEIQRRYREDPAALVAYNREDARLVLDILEQEGLLELALERSLLSGMQLDRVGASIASFDLLYLPELRRRGFVAASVERDRKSERVKGGALLDPQPGVFRNVAVFDFKSLYPSLIRTFQLDPLAHATADDDQDVVAPNGARFSRRDAILPEVIERFMERRDDAKARGDRHADQAIKIMMNAMFGVLGAPSCRFFDAEVANAITGFGQQILHWTRDAFEDAGMRVLYGDTDSVFVKLSDEVGDKRAQAEVLRDQIQQRIQQRIRKTYQLEPRLELELERVYDRFFLPHVRGGKSGSKKRYAGWSQGELEIVGLEAVRRDWPAVAGRLQRGLLERLFTDREVVCFAKRVTDSVLAGELDEELVYVKRIRKGSLDRYTATTPPHVQAARKAVGQVGRIGPIVRYVITATGPEPVLAGRPLPPQIDHRHYVERVLRPIADAILQPLGFEFAEALGEPRQLSLL